jgi:predicted PurR-regulated permease PerM
MEASGKIARGLLITVLVLAILLILKNFLIPLAYGLLLALIIYPVCKKLERRGLPRPLAIFLSMLVVIALAGIVIAVLVFELRALNRDLPQLLDRLSGFLGQAQEWLRDTFGISRSDQDALASDIGKNLAGDFGKVLKGSVTIAAGTVLFIVIVPLYSVLFLSYRNVLVNFLASLAGDRLDGNLGAILGEVILAYYRYIRGMFFVYIIVGILNSIGLLLFGVDHAILFGMLTAFMTIIPYFGIIVSSALPIAVVWAETNNFWYPLGVVAVFTFVQYLEANIIFPYVVGKQIDLNTLVSLAVIMLGGVVWGVSGMILFLPFVGIVKIVAGHFEELKPLEKVLESPGKKKKKHD